jgi:hypothetical protein
LLRDEKNIIESERDSLKAIVDKLSPSNKNNDVALINSQYWGRLSKLASLAINDYPKWKEKQRRVQKTGNLQEWLTQTVQADNREAEIIKKILSDFFQELR